MKEYKITREIPFMDVGTIVHYDPINDYKIVILNGIVEINTNAVSLRRLINEGWLEEVKEEKMITIKGKEYSESTIKEALKEYVSD